VAVARLTSCFPIAAGRILFELNNIVNEHYTGIFSTTLSVTFYAPTADFPRPRSADLILPLTTLSKTGSQMLVYPGDSNVNVDIPINAAEAWLEAIATGAAEEVRCVPRLRCAVPS
jgi:hypothetical protein